MGSPVEPVDVGSPVALVVFVFVCLFGTDAGLHLVRGLLGERRATPFGSEPSAARNVLWGSVDAAVAVASVRTYRDATDASTPMGAFVAGGGLAVGLASDRRSSEPRPARE